MFQFFDFIYFFFALLILVLGALVLFNRLKSKNNLVFFLISLSAIGWMLSLYFGYGYADYADFENGLFWMRLSYGFSILGISFMTIFIYLFPRVVYDFPKYIKYAYLLLTFVLFIIAGFTPLINDFFLIKNDIYIKDTFGPLYFIYASYIIINLIVSVFLAIIKLKNIKGVERGKIAYVAYGYFLFVFLAVATNVVLPIFDIIILQREIPILILAFVLPSYYAIHRYRFLNFSNSTLNLLRKIILYTIFFFFIFVVFRLFLFLFPEQNIIFISLISSFLGLIFIKWIEEIFPELISESFREFRNVLTKFKSKVYSCNTSYKLHKLIDHTFLIDLNYVNAKIYVIRDKKEKMPIPIYLKNKFTKRLEDFEKDILIKEEIKFQKRPKGVKRFLVASLNNLDANLCLPLFSEKKLIGFFVLNKKEDSSYSQEEIEELIKLRKHLEIGLMNILLKMNLEEENNLMKAIIDRKTKNLKKKIAQIKELLRQQSDFIAVTAHEFRTPLNIATFQMEEVLESTKEKNLAEDLKVIDSSLGNLKNLMQKMFSVQQYDLNKVEVNKEKVSIKSYVKDIYTDFIPLMKKKKIKFTFKDKLKGRLYAKIDKAQIRQVFNNILNNAHMHVAEKGKVEIKLEKAPKGYLIKISDNGKGIPNSSKKRIFEKFQTMSHGKGIGLGLYICKKIIELHNGKIWVEDSKFDGAAFCFLLRK